jgi:hypothetical protein
MAQTGNFSPIQLYSSSTPGNAPAVGNLVNSTLGSELAINIADGKLFYKDSSNAIQVIAWKVVPATAGGTGQTSYTTGDLLYANSGTTLAKLADVATGNALISGGVGVAPSYGKIGLTTHVSGTLPTANGGTNLTSFTSGGAVYATSTSVLTTGTLPVTAGGTGLTAVTAGYIPYGSSSTALSTSADGFFFDATNVRLGIFNTAPATTLDAHGTVRATRRGATSQYVEMLATSGGSQLNVSAGSGALSISTNGGTTPMVVLDGSGNLLVGTTTTSFSNTDATAISAAQGYILQNHINGSASGKVYTYFAYNATQIGSISQNGTAGVLYNITSDYRLKTVVASVTDAGKRLDELQPIEYDWNTGGRTRGFLAHQFAEVYPNSVTGEKDAVDLNGNPVYQSMQASSSEVMADLISEIQSIRKRLIALEAK